MSESDEYEKQLLRLSKLEADAEDDNGDSNLNIKKEKSVDENKEYSDAKEEKDGILNQQPSASKTSESESSSDSGEGFRRRKKPLNLRITRNATGSLPKETKTLLMETTEMFDPNNTKQRPKAKKGFVRVLAPECTSCGSDVILRVYQRRMLIHPYLKTAVCRQCHEFYHSDVFGVDDEGSQLYCVWCGEGGELIYCDQCEKAFCSECIKRNFGKQVKKSILEQSKWDCFMCEPNMIENHRKTAEMIVKYQNLCIKDPYLVQEFECEVTKQELQKENYQQIVSQRIKQRNVAKLISSSQQKEESQKDSAPSDDDRSDADEQNGNSSDGNSSDQDQDYLEAEKERKLKYIQEYKQKQKSKATENGSKKSSSADSSDDSDDDKFIESIRKKAKERTQKQAEQSLATESSSKSVNNTTNNREEKDSSDDSLFDTGNPNIKAKKVMHRLQGSSDEEPGAESDENDEVLQKYRNKLAAFKEVPDYKQVADKESDQSNYSSELPSSDDESSAESVASSNSSLSKSEDEEKEGKEKSKNGIADKNSASNDNEDKGEESSKDKSIPTKKKRRRRKKKDVTDSESENNEKQNGTKKKRKRKRKKNSSESESEYDENGKKKRKSKKGKRRKIRKILGQNQLQKETINAQKEEDMRRQKIKEKTLPSQQGRLLNFILEDLRKEKYRSKPPTIDDEEKGRVIEVHKHLKKRLKPHQLDGIQFMYDCCIESVEKVKDGSEGSGCILAHCMGLGKTFQVITFVSTILNYHYIFGFKRVLVVCPLNTVLNWQAEFDKWLKNMDDAPEVSILSDNIHSNDKRADIIENWYHTSGVLILGYQLYRLLSVGSNVRKKKLKDLFRNYLVEPGPDIVICDEGHIIKNEKTGISKALNSLKSKRRIILTGTPLQNNLVEYHCMVSFVKPNLLGTTKEFKNMYENPINNGQCVDATEFDIKIMKERSHILFEQLSACVQRRDYLVLRDFLPKKYEYVLSIKLSDLQVKLYQKFLDRASSGGKIMSRLFESYQTLKKVWTHPWLLEIDAVKNEKDSIEDFITDREDTSEASWEASSEDSDFGSRKKKKAKKARKEKEAAGEEVKEVKEPEIPDAEVPESADAEMVSAIADTIVPMGSGINYDWFKGEMTEKDEKMLEHSGKLLVTLEILDKASQKGDKVLLFSQSLLALDFLETSINRVGWMKGRDYFRMDGSTKTQQRSLFQRKFNDKSNKRCRLFLISTKAGGLGINLVAANRIILFDMSWNPSDDTQSLFRAYRYGQTKNVYVYRLVARGTMEEKIYDRQVYKESLSSRVVDEKQISRYFSANDLQELFAFDPSAQTCTTSVLANHNPPADDVLASILVDLDPPLVLEYHEHDSLLEHRPEQQLTEEERKAAWENFKADKERRNVVNAPMGQQSVFQRLAAHTQMYSGPIITPIFSSAQELILGGFTPEQILSIQQQLEPVVQSGRLKVKALGQGQLHIEGLGPEQQSVFINSIREQQKQQIQAAQIARVLPQQHIINQLPPAERAIFQQRLQMLMQQQIQQQQQQQQQPTTQAIPIPIVDNDSSSAAPITVPDSPLKR